MAVFGLNQERHPLLALGLVFVLWKAVLMVIALTSPGPGYDTSTTLLDFSTHSQPASGRKAPLISNFIRWDAIYFTQMAQRGHIFEQEWAFGKGISSDLLWSAQGIFRTAEPNIWQIATAGLVASHAAHFVSTILLWAIVSHLDYTRITKHSHIAYVTAVLYVLSPAGIFISAPYSESFFAFRSFLGLYLLIVGIPLRGYAHKLGQLASYILGGAVLGRATVTRSNGILGGLFFAIDAVEVCLEIIQDGITGAGLLTLASIVTGGLLVGWGMLSPQLEAYSQYCTTVAVDQRRPWCQRSFPSIFTFVQSYYWNVGPFRYWTFSNLPLFALAAPMLWLMIYSSSQCIPMLRANILRQHKVSAFFRLNQAWLWRLALQQLILAVLALTSYHVQIITRLSSGYLLWYIWIAARICDGQDHVMSKATVRWMVLYACIQGGLFASFLPPA